MWRCSIVYWRHFLHGTSCGCSKHLSISTCLYCAMICSVEFQCLAGRKSKCWSKGYQKVITRSRFLHKHSTKPVMIISTTYLLEKWLQNGRALPANIGRYPNNTVKKGTSQVAVFLKIACNTLYHMPQLSYIHQVTRSSPCHWEKWSCETARRH